MTTTRLWVGTFVSVSLALGVAAASERVQSERLAPLAIGGISPGMSTEVVIDRLGPALSQKASSGFIVRRLFYRNMTIGFDEDGLVAFVESKSNDACMLTKICPGASVNVVTGELRGGGYLFGLHGDMLTIRGDGCWGELKISNGRAKYLRIRCSP